MATSKKEHETVDPEVAIESAIGKTELFIEKNSKTLLYILTAIVVVVGGYYGWKYLYSEPRMKKAADQMFVAEQLFAADQYQPALEGDGNNSGFLEIIDQFGSTPQGNLARQYAGICYMKLGKPEEALEILAKYKHTEGAPNALVNAQNFGLQGDILTDKGEYKQALAMYEKAIAAAENPFTTPYYLKKAGLVCEKTGDAAGALSFYKRISDDFGASMEARDIEKSIGRVNQAL